MSDDTQGTFHMEDLKPNPLEELPSTRRNMLDVTQNPQGGQVIERRKQATLVMLSGGIDNTYALTRLLRDCDDDIIAHHVHLINPENRHAIEADRCRRIVDHCRRTYRDFYFTESAIDRHRLRSFGRDVHTIAFEAGFVATSFMIDRGYRVDRWTFGSSLDDVISLGQDTEFEDTDIMQQCIKLSCRPVQQPRMFQLPYISRRAQMDYMGDALTALCWTCRQPVYRDNGYVEECGECPTCVLMARIRRGEDTIPRRMPVD